ncbi:MAG: hypothetical protein V3U72_02830 [Candidatus Aenigmarchaeota archaeon]
MIAPIRPELERKNTPMTAFRVFRIDCETREDAIKENVTIAKRK